MDVITVVVFYDCANSKLVVINSAQLNNHPQREFNLFGVNGTNVELASGKRVTTVIIIT